MTHWTSFGPCPVCGETVNYGPGRRKCQGCGSWCHDRCSVDSRPFHSLRKAYCHACVRDSPLRALTPFAKAVNNGGRFPALEVVIWSLLFGQDETEIADKLELPPERVREWASRLREQGFWKDGKVLFEDGAIGDGLLFSTCLILYALCATGQIRRAQPVDGGPELVWEGGGNENGKQEAEQD